MTSGLKMTTNKDKKRAVSREAARKRRCIESSVFGDLSHLLPVPPSVQDSLDKPSVIRLSISYIRLKHVFTGTGKNYGHTWTEASGASEGLKDLKEDMKTVGHEPVDTSEIMKVLEGFLMVVSSEGLILFTSDNVTGYIGFMQLELMGHNIFDFTHPSDHEEMRSNLHLLPEKVWCAETRDFVIRIKSALTNRGKSSNLKSASFKVLHCRGRVHVSGLSESCWLLLCQPLPLTHTIVNQHTFTSQHTMDMRFTQCDHRVRLLLGYRPEDLLGRSIYEVCHTLDTSLLTKHHVNLFVRSQSVCGPYHLLARSGGYVWAETHSAVVPILGQHKSSKSKEGTLGILSVTYVLSGVEQPSIQFSLDQSNQKLKIGPNPATTSLMVCPHSKKVGFLPGHLTRGLCTLESGIIEGDGSRQQTNPQLPELYNTQERSRGNRFNFLPSELSAHTENVHFQIDV